MWFAVIRARELPRSCPDLSRHKRITRGKITLGNFLMACALLLVAAVAVSLEDWPADGAQETALHAALLPTGDAEQHGGLTGLQQKRGGLVSQMPGCREALTRTRTQCEAYWPPDRCTNTTWQIFWSQHARIAYVKTAKAGSVSIKDYMYQHLGPITKLTDIMAVLPADVFTFTFVREPVGRALAAYAEVDGIHRIRTTGGNVKAEHDFIWSLPREVRPRYSRVDRSLADGEARFVAYLDDLVEGRVPVEWEASHSRPIADHLRGSHSHLSFIGRLEDLKGDWPKWQRQAGLPAKRITSMPPEDHFAKNEAYLEAESVPQTDRVLQKVCQVYAADFECYGYPVPAACLTGGQR